jgi:hypothetical protein
MLQPYGYGPDEVIAIKSLMSWLAFHDYHTSEIMGETPETQFFYPLEQAPENGEWIERRDKPIGFSFEKPTGANAVRCSCKKI